MFVCWIVVCVEWEVLWRAWTILNQRAHGWSQDKSRKPVWDVQWPLVIPSELGHSRSRDWKLQWNVKAAVCENIFISTRFAPICQIPMCHSLPFDNLFTCMPFVVVQFTNQQRLSCSRLSFLHWIEVMSFTLLNLNYPRLFPFNNKWNPWMGILFEYFWN